MVVGAGPATVSLMAASASSTAPADRTCRRPCAPSACTVAPGNVVEGALVGT